MDTFKTCLSCGDVFQSMGDGDDYCTEDCQSLSLESVNNFYFEPLKQQPVQTAVSVSL